MIWAQTMAKEVDRTFEQEEAEVEAKKKVAADLADDMVREVEV